MGKTFAIAIGINQYQHFQPLNYAQQDAQALWDLWTQRLGIPSNQCFLLTDSAQAINGQSTYPERETLQNWLDYLSGDGQWPIRPCNRAITSGASSAVTAFPITVKTI